MRMQKMQLVSHAALIARECGPELSAGQDTGVEQAGTFQAVSLIGQTESGAGTRRNGGVVSRLTA